MSPTNPSPNRILLAALLLFPLGATPPGHATEIRLLAGSVITSQTGAGQTHPVAISADGRYVLLRSTAPNLVAGQVDRNGAADVFLRDRSSGSIVLVSHAAGAPAAAADQGSLPVAMSPDGEWVVFTSWADDLIAGLVRAAPYSSDVYLWRRSTGTTILVSRLPGGPLQAAGSSRAVAMTPDGAFVMFDSEATGLVAGVADTNAAADVFLFSRASGGVALVSAAGGATGNGASNGVDLSDDGAAVFFNSSASNLVAGDNNQRDDAFVRMPGGPVGRLVAAAAGTAARAISPNGRWVLVDGLDGRTQIFDRVTAALETLATESARGLALSADGSRALFEVSGGGAVRTHYHETGAPPVCLNCRSTFGGGGDSLSPDGRFASYWDEDNGLSVARLYDDTTGSSAPVLPAGTTEPLVGSSFSIGMSADAAVLVMAARDAGLSVGLADRNGNFDAFAIRRATGAVELLSASSGPGPVAATLGDASYPAGSSPDGDEILFRGPADLLDPAEPIEGVAAWAYRVADGRRRLLSPLPGQPQVPASGQLQPLALGEDGRVLLSGYSNDLVPAAPFTWAPQIYLYLPATQSYRLITARAGQPTSGTAGFLDQIRPGRALASQVLFTASPGAADLVAGLAPLSATNLFSCDLGGAGCRLLSQDLADPLRGANAAIQQLSASAEAAAAVFASDASNLFEGQSGGHINAFSWREGSGIELLSRSAADPERAANGATWPCAISADGHFAVAHSLATDLDEAALDGNGTLDVFLADLETGSWELVSGSALDPGIAASGFSRGLSISANGRFVLFSSTAPDLVAGMKLEPVPAGNNLEAAHNLFVYDRATRQKRLVSHLPGESLAAASYSAYGYLSRDGSRVAFQSASPGLVPTGSPGGLFLWDSAGTDGAAGGLQLIRLGRGGPYVWPGLFPIVLENQELDGSLLPFWSFHDNLTPGDTNGWGDAYVALLDGLFRDGFESGGTGAWSRVLQ